MVAAAVVGTVRLRSPQLAVAVDCARGGKITSLRDRSSGREWLLQTTGEAETPRYGDVFTEQPLYGWDEMFPTVDACRYLGEDVELPDHGEVWSQPWQVENRSETALTCVIDGTALDYRLRRTITVDGTTVRLDYRLSTLRKCGMDALWAPHPQFAVLPGTVLRLPGGVGELTARAEGAEQSHRVALPEGGLDWRDVVDPGAGMMLYTDPDVRICAAELVDPDGGRLRMSWDSRRIPYFAAWIDRGRYAPGPVLCPEPMTGYYDSLRTAQEQRRVLHVEPASPVVWTLTVEIGQRCGAKGVDGACGD